jgi:hypothetical protein
VFKRNNAKGRDDLASEPRDRHETGTRPVLDERLHQYCCLPIYFADDSGNRSSSARTDASTSIRPSRPAAINLPELDSLPASQGAQLTRRSSQPDRRVAQRSAGATRYDRDSHRGSRTNYRQSKRCCTELIGTNYIPSRQIIICLQIFHSRIWALIV